MRIRNKLYVAFVLSTTCAIGEASVWLDAGSQWFYEDIDCRVVLHRSSADKGDKGLLSACLAGFKELDVVNNNPCRVYCGDEERLSVPCSIGGRPVVEIGDYAFMGLDRVLSINVSPGVASIGDGAFACCSCLEEVYLPDGVLSLGKFAFARCPNLRKVRLGKGVRSLDCAFEKCGKLESLDVPSGVISINGSFEGCCLLTRICISDTVSDLNHVGFENCVNLSRIEVDESNECYYAVSGVLYSRIDEELVCVPSAWIGRELIIPQGVRRLTAQSQCKNKSVKLLAIPDSVEEVDLIHLRDFSMLERVTVAEGNRQYCSVDGALYDRVRKNLLLMPRVLAPSHFEFQHGIDSVADGVFFGCDNVQSVSFPDTVKNIGRVSFMKCSSLVSCRLPPQLKTIKMGAFARSGLKTISFPSALSTIECMAFSGCKNLERLSFGRDVCFVSSGGRVVYETKLDDRTLGPCRVDVTAFDGCQVLKAIVVVGHEMSWECVRSKIGLKGSGTPRQAWLNYHDERNMNHKQTEM